MNNKKLKKCREFLNKTNLFSREFFAPGLYRIICLKNNKIYIGETKCFFNRLAEHFSDLMCNQHPCKDLQKDFNKYGIAYFEARIICSGQKWEKKDIRLLEEMYLSTNIGVDNLYSIPKKLKKLSHLYQSYKKDEPILLTKTFNVLNKTNWFCEAFIKPCLYKITCLKTNKEYIGETGGFLLRLIRHLIALDRKIHHCKSLQKAYNEFGRGKFSAVVIDYGDQWKEPAIRREEEKRIVNTIGLQNLYNFDEKKIDRSPKSYKYEGKSFVSIESLRAYINEQGKNNDLLLRSAYSRPSFRRHFLNENSPRRNEIVFIQKTKRVKQFQQYKVCGKIYFGMEEIVANKLAKNKRQAEYRLSSSKWPDYEFINKRTHKKRQRTLSINGKIYTSKQAIDQGLVKNQSILYYRLTSKSPTWKTWFWVD